MFDRREFLVARAVGLLVGGEGGGNGLFDDVVAVGVEVEQGLADGGFELVGVEAVDVAALVGAVPVTASAHVVAVSAVSPWATVPMLCRSETRSCWSGGVSVFVDGAAEHSRS